MKAVVFFALVICAVGPMSGRVIGGDAPFAIAQEKPSADTTREFHAAVAAGDMRLATKMLGIYPDLFSTSLPDDDARQVTPILTAVNNGQEKMVAMLLKRGASYKTGKPGATPVFRAALLGHTGILKLLLEAGANVDGLDDGANGAVLESTASITPLRAALCCGKIDTARFLVAEGAEIDIYSAAGLGWNNWVARQVKDHPEQTTAKDRWNFKPMTYAVACGCAGTAEILLANGADVNEVSPIDHGTFLHLAALNGSGDLITVMLAHGANFNVKNDKAETALDLAEKSKQEDTAQTLREHGGKRGSQL